MGISFHEFAFLKFSFKKKQFKTLGILGRQENYLNSDNKFIPINLKKYVNEKYSDNLLINYFKLENLKTFDVSEKDSPSELANFNSLIENPKKFDSFFDGGSLQHTFNIPIVMKNISNHVKIGGSIIHVVSSNNLCGFGFYQFSPEFFIKYYSEQNGFRNTDIFVADYDNLKNWYKLKNNPLNNTSINTSARLICLVRTEKYIDIEIKEIFQDIFFKNSNKNQIDNTKNNKINKRYLFQFFSKILLFLDLISKKINLIKNKNLEIKKIFDLIN